MTTILSPIAGSSFPSTLVGPSDGEAANALSINSPLQSVINGLAAAQALLYGGGIRRRVICTDSVTMTIQPLGAVLVTDGAGIWRTLAHNSPSSVSPTTIAGSLSANTRYWVYAYYNAGSVSFVASANAPDSGLRYENANTQRLYISTFITDGSSAVVAYNQVDSLFEYSTHATSGGNLLLTTGHAVVPTAISFGVSVPTNAQIAKIALSFGSATGDTGSFFNAQDSTIPVTTLYSPAGSRVLQEADFSQTSAHSINYVLDSGTSFATVWAMGFTL